MNRYLCRLGSSFLSTRKDQHLKLIKDQLANLFQSKESISSLSSVFQILPFYFTKKYLEDFSNSTNIQKYIQYIHGKQPDKKKFTELEKRYLSQNAMRLPINCRNAVYLQAYMHWLMNECSEFNLQNNDFMMEYIHLQSPQKLFEPHKNKEKRTFIYHHGPTNSGKSTSAIQQLKTLNYNQKGIYMAPLRLLAWEYQKKLGNCSLITGQQKQYKNSNLVSCTIEAANLNEEYSVAVIDEIQMIADKERGWAWTKAVLALKAKRIHLCGDERALGIIGKLLEQSGDILEERRYSRLSKLVLIHKNFKLEKIEAGDCIIEFSSNRLMQLRNNLNEIISLKEKAKQQQAKKKQKNKVKEQAKIEQPPLSKNHTAIIHGRMPPECRKEQANYFNQRKLPYLVATNAIGMGLNLSIKKIIFMTVEKPSGDGMQEELLEHEIQQIAGRAGRGKQTGYVQCLNNNVLQKVKRALSSVNLHYDIQLENIKDQTGQAVRAEPEIEQYRKKKPSKQMFNGKLGRFMRQNEYQIQRACFYFTNNYLIDCKLRMNWLVGVNLPILEQLDFLKRYSKLNNLYFYQDTTHLAYLVRLLEKNQFDLRDLLYFYNALSLSIVSDNRWSIGKKVQRAHRQLIQNFIKFRRVPLPGFLVKLYRYQRQEYQYMEQITELQLYYHLLETYVWLWNKYEFAFYEFDKAKEIKIFISNKISRILVQNKFKVKKQKKQTKEDQEGSKVIKNQPNLQATGQIV